MPGPAKQAATGMTVPILIDCDPGHDDAIALLLALASPEVELLGVTTVHGNQTLEKTTANALRVLELAGRSDVPVGAGARGGRARPWRERPRRACAPGTLGPSGRAARSRAPRRAHPPRHGARPD